MTTGTSSDERESVRVRFPAEVLASVDESVRDDEFDTRDEFVGEAIRRAAAER